MLFFPTNNEISFGFQGSLSSGASAKVSCYALWGYVGVQCQRFLSYPQSCRRSFAYPFFPGKIIVLLLSHSCNKCNDQRQLGVNNPKAGTFCFGSFTSLEEKSK